MTSVSQLHVLNDDSECVPIVIGCCHLIGRLVASDLSRYIKYELDRVGILNDQIVSITTDNGSAILKKQLRRSISVVESLAWHTISI